jgi:hypothetical protein
VSPSRAPPRSFSRTPSTTPSSMRPVRTAAGRGARG